MSFSEEVKNEILNKKNKNCCLIPLRYGELITESKEILVKDIKKVTKNNCCKKALLKGAFLGSGSINDPNKDYHFEITVISKVYSNLLLEIANLFDVNLKVTKRQDRYVLYLKDSEQISTILKVLGASKAVLEYENIRISKSIKNDINRSINCETANLNKVADASVKQINAINKLKKVNKFNELSSKLREIANLRLEFPEASLEELANNCSYKISKSGVYHRLNKIIKISEEKWVIT